MFFGSKKFNIILRNAKSNVSTTAILKIPLLSATFLFTYAQINSIGLYNIHTMISGTSNYFMP